MVNGGEVPPLETIPSPISGDILEVQLVSLTRTFLTSCPTFQRQVSPRAQRPAGDVPVLCIDIYDQQQTGYELLFAGRSMWTSFQV